MAEFSLREEMLKEEKATAGKRGFENEEEDEEKEKRDNIKKREGKRKDLKYYLGPEEIFLLFPWNKRTDTRQAKEASSPLSSVPPLLVCVCVFLPPFLGGFRPS